MSHKEDTSLIASDAESLLVSVSKIIASLACIETEKEAFLEIGCYFYRASVAIMELQTAEDTPTSIMEIVQSLSKSICLVKNLLEDCQNGINHPIKDSEVIRCLVQKLEREVKHMGETMSLIPSSTYAGQEYAEVALQALSKEMQNARFEVCETPTSQSHELELHPFAAEEQLKQEPEPKPEPTEADLYPVNVEESIESSQVLSVPHLVNFPKSASDSAQRKHGIKRYLTTLPQLAEYIEPLYDTFFCPLTKKIMDDPVTIESGVTYDKKAITEWFEKFENSEEIPCPTTGKILLSRVLSANVALKTTIEVWRERNETARIKVARAALSLESSEVMVIEAMEDLQSICKGNQYNMVQVRNLGMLPLLIKFVEHNDRNVSCAALELLRELAQNDEESKEMIAKTLDMSTIIEMLSSTHQQVRHGSLLFLLELSKSQSLCEELGSGTGVILMLITTKYNRSTDAFASEKADEILRNLEKSPNNIKLMAENGLLEPLVNHLTEGSEEMKTEMAGYLGEIVLGDNSNNYAAERASPSLIKMVHSGNTLARREAFKALKQISSYHPNGKILIESGVIQIMVAELFTRRIYNEPMNSKEDAAAVLANILESELELENLQANTHGHTMTSDYVVCNLICMLKSSVSDKLNINLLRILLCLTKFPKSSSTIVSIVKETDASYILVEFINNPDEELGVTAIKLLISLSSYMGHMIAERLCKIGGQPESLIHSSTGGIQITERQAVSANLLAKLPHQSLALNLAFLDKNTVPTILQAINHIQRSGTRTSRYAGAYLEGLVGTLVRFTTTLYEPRMLLLARTHNFTLIFTELLMQTSSDEVQRLSAIGLENLSAESINLSEPPQIKKTKSTKLLCMPKFLPFGLSKIRKIPVCPIHRGACSSQNTFCLVEAKAVERLLTCLDHENAEVVEAALSALCTLLDDKVDLDKSVSMLSEMNTINHVLNVVKAHKQEGLWHKSFWVIEKFLMKTGDKWASDISEDRFLPATLVSAFHHGDRNTRQIAEKILRHLNKMPSFSTPSCTM